MLTIDFMDETETLKDSDIEFVEKILQHAATEENIGDAEVSVSFVTN